jgi:hypothetical protein
MKNILWSLVFMLFAAGICSAQSTLYFPQFVDGIQGGNGIVWWTTIGVSNPADPGTAIASGTVALTKNDGTPMNITLFDLSGKAGNTFQLAGGQTKVFVSPATISPTPSPLVAGFATVTSNLPVVGFLTFLEGAQSGSLISLATVLAATPGTRIGTGVTQYPTVGTSTGVAVANPGTVLATVTFQLLDGSGTPLAPAATRTIAAGNQTSFFVSELFPNAPSVVLGGSMRMTSDKSIVSTALLFQGSLFATLPVFVLP